MVASSFSFSSLIPPVSLPSLTRSSASQREASLSLPGTLATSEAPKRYEALPKDKTAAAMVRRGHAGVKRGQKSGEARTGNETESGGEETNGTGEIRSIEGL